MENKLEWWGYKHTNGTYQAKRYFSSSASIGKTESDVYQYIRTCRNFLETDTDFRIKYAEFNKTNKII